MAITITIEEYLDDVGTLTGPFGSGTTTDDTTPLLRGQITQFSTGDFVFILRDGAPVGLASVVAGAGGSASWSYQDKDLADGNYTYTAMAFSMATSTGGMSTPFNITVSTTPTVTLPTPTIVSVLDDQGAVTGPVSNGGTTDDGTPTLQGTLTAALTGTQAVHIFRGAEDVGTATVTGGSTNWQFTDPTGLANGNYSYTAKVIDGGGTAGQASGAYTITVAPDPTGAVTTTTTLKVWDDAAPVTGWVVDGDKTNDETPIIQGTLSAPLAAGETVHVFRSVNGAASEDWGQATVTGTDWSFQDYGLNTLSYYTYTARVVGAAGNGPMSDSVTFQFDNIDVNTDLQIREIIDDVEPVTGQIPNNGYTNDNAPTLKGTFSMVLNTGDHLVVERDGTELPGTATVDAGNKTWSYQDSGLTDGEHTYILRLRDGGGAQLGKDSNPWVINVDTKAPIGIVTIENYTDDVAPVTGNFNTGTVTDDTRPMLNGKVIGLEIGESIEVYQGTNLLGTASVSVTSGDGTWSYQIGSDLADGNHTFTAKIVDLASNPGIPSDDFNLTVNTTPPLGTVSIVNYTDDVAPLTGTFNSGTATNDPTPQLNGTVTGLQSGDIIEVYQGATLLGTASASVASGNGSWSYQITSALADGDYTFTAQVVNTAGTPGIPSSAFNLTVDTTPPIGTASIVNYTDDVEPLTGNFNNGTATNDNTPKLNGTVTGLESGDTIEIYQGTTLLGIASASVASGNGNWSYQITSALADGDYTYTAKVVDSAGNPGTPSSPFTLTVDTLPPTGIVSIDTYFDDVGPQTGVFDSTVPTDDTKPQLNGTVTGLESGDTIEVYQGTTLLGMASVSVASGNGDWSYQITSDLTNGSYTYMAKVVDSAGNLGTPSGPFTLTVDTTTPIGTASIVNYTDDVEPLTGNFLSGTATNDPTPTLNGTVTGLQSGDTIEVYQGATLLGIASVSVASGSGTWSYQIASALADGDYTFTAQVVNTAGTPGTPSGLFTLTVDTTPPPGTVTIETYTDDVGPLTGDFNTGTTTDDTQPKLNGRVFGLESGDIIEVYQGATLLGTASVSVASGDGTWSYQITSDLADGVYTFTAKVVDPAGNPSLVSDTFTLTVDTLPPPTAAITGIMDDVTPVTGLMTHSGDPSNDSTPELHGTVSAALTADQTVLIYRDNVWIGNVGVFTGLDWTFTDDSGGMTNGQTYTYTAKVVSGTGVPGTPSAEYEMTLNLGGQVKINPIAGNDVLDPTEAAGNVTISGTLENMPSSTTASSVQVVVNVGGTSYNASVTGTDWNVTVAGSALNAAMTGGRGSVGVTLSFEDNMHTAATVTASRGYLQHTEPSPVSLYSVGTAKAGLGYSMSVISDFNGDGYADYLVSAPGTRYDGGYVRTPAANYVLYGGPGGLPNIGGGLASGNLDLITAAQGFKITSSYIGGHFTYTKVPGGTVTDIGDFNGDGLSDIAMVTPIDNSVYVIYGQAGTPWQSLDLARLTPSQGFKITGATGFLYGVTGVDVNGDGYSDLIFSDPTAGPKVQNVTSGMGGGAAYVIYGHAGTQGNINTTGNSTSSNGPTDGNSITLVGAGTAGTGYTVLTSVGAPNLGTTYNVGGNTNNNSGYTGLGTVVSAVGDVNGDGYQDFAINAPGGQNWGSSAPGSAYVVFGGPNSVVKGGTVSMAVLENMAANGQGFKISASNLYEFLGGKHDSGGPEGRGADAVYGQYHTLSGLGNIDGSGHNAFAIGSPGAINPNTGAEYRYPGLYSDGAGAVYVIYGDSKSLANITLPTYSGGTWTNLSSLMSVGGFVIYSKTFAATANGTVAGASDLGFAVSSAGDVNGDGITDFLIGAPMAGNSKGAVFLVFGTADKEQLWAIDPITKLAQPGVVDLDQLVANGKLDVFGAPGTAVQYNGALTNLNSNYTPGVSPTSGGTGSNMGTDVTGGDYSGTGLSGYTFSAWGDNVWNGQTGQVYNYDGTTALLTQAIDNANGAVYYAGSGIDRIVTGSGSNVWVHGIGGADDASTDPKLAHDAASGGKGSNYIGIVSTNFTGINGGGGTDTVVFEASGIKLNLAEMKLKVQNIEQFDLNNQTNTATTDPHGTATGLTTGNALELRVTDVLSQMSDAPSGQRMTVLGDNTSTVILDGSYWMSTGMTAAGGLNFTVWHNATMGANTAADLLIQQGVLVTF